ncbi:amidohydrolase family protein [Acidobacterium sp. S8]|uniref:amidohydrolase family protein n=1 Tax=Acidobacterium sp. S8 TaxID=1641854 RepID=UPI001C206B6A|nr:amidohydrolase family protein [Acidobacterium sp. S8]
MTWISRRKVLSATGMSILSGGLGRLWGSEFAGDSRVDKAQKEGENEPLALANYEPASMLRLQETHVARARYPVIDFHTHLTHSAHTVNGVALGAERVIAGPPKEMLAVMERKNILALTNLTGGFGAGLQGAVSQYDKSFPTRFYTFTEPSYNLFQEPNYAQLQADAILSAHQAGACGLKILKTLGLYLSEQTTTGNLVKVDDPRFDPMWETCVGLQMPVAIHVSDPLAFFRPTDRFNERYEELSNHPDWSFAGPRFPSNDELLQARNRVFARHPRTNFVALHVGNLAEDLANVAENLDRYPNMNVDIAARLNELGRQPRATRKFFDKYQDRILFGTDATPQGEKFPQQVFNDSLYEIYFRFLETDDEYFDYAPAPIPPQGRWRISGVDLPDSILRKIYNQNAARLLNISVT